MAKFFDLRVIAGVSAAIIGTGLFLNSAGQGRFGDAAKNLAQKVTQGYGV